MNRKPYLRAFLALAAAFCALPVFSAVIYVNPDANGANNGTSWENAFYNLHDALSAAQYGDEIWAAQGIYYPHPWASANRDASFHIPNGVKMYGGFSGSEQNREERDWTANLTILSGANGLEPNGLNDAYTVVYLENCDSTTLLDGFELREGLANSNSDSDPYSGRRKNGGAAYLYAAGAGNFCTPRFVNCRFVANIASGRGGAIMGLGTNGGYVCPRFRACTWQYNSAGSDGGAFYIQNQEGENSIGATFRLDSCQMVLNHVEEGTSTSTAGGAFFSAANGNRAVVENCFFFGNGKARNSATYALYISSRYTPLEAQMRHCRFINNQGGAWFVSQERTGTLLVDSCRFERNGAANLENSRSPLSYYGPQATVRNCSFADNAAENGGGIFLAHASGTVSGCTFRNNACARIGSALFFSNENEVRVQDCLFEENKASLGGAAGFRQPGNRADFVNCIFLRNYGQAGGAIRNDFVDGSRMRYINCLFYENAAAYGGLCYAEGFGHQLDFYNSIIYRNTSTSNSFIASLQDANVNFYNCLTDVEGCSQLALADTSFYYVYDDAGNPIDTVILPSGGNASCSQVVFGANPLFADTAAADFHLLPGSPALNAGLNSILDSVGLQYDLNGAPRIAGGTVDIGPYELPLNSGFNALLSFVSPVSCHNGTDGEIGFFITGEPPFEYNWENEEGAGQGLTGLSAGLYRFTVSDAAGNSQVFENIDVSQPPPLALPIDVSGISCPGAADGVVKVPAFGGTPPYFFTWNTGAPDSVLTGLSAGQYYVTVTDANGCSRTGGASLPGPEEFSITAEASEPLCGADADGHIRLSISGGTPPYSVFWNNGRGGPVVEGLSGGNYQATVLDANGCRDSLRLTLEAPPVLEAGIDTAEPSCYGSTDGELLAEASGGIPPYSYTWSNGAEGPVLEELPAGPYSLSLTDANGCLYEAAVNLGEPDSLFAEYSITPPSASGASDGAIAIEGVSGGAPPFSYSWSTGEHSPVAGGLAAGVYLLTITDSNGCRAFYDFELSPLSGQAGPVATGFVHLFPNPCLRGGAAVLEWPEKWGALLKVETFNAQGERLGETEATAITAGRCSLATPAGEGAFILKALFREGRVVALKWIILSD